MSKVTIEPITYRASDDRLLGTDEWAAYSLFVVQDHEEWTVTTGSGRVLARYESRAEATKDVKQRLPELRINGLTIRNIVARMIKEARS